MSSVEQAAREACDCKYCDWLIRERVQTTCRRDKFAIAISKYTEATIQEHKNAHDAGWYDRQFLSPTFRAAYEKEAIQEHKEDAEEERRLRLCAENDMHNMSTERDEHSDRADRAERALKLDGMCDVGMCHESDVCACGGSGRMSDTVAHIRVKLFDTEAELAALKERIREREGAWRHTKNENLVAASRAASDGNKRVFNKDASDCAIIELELHTLLEPKP